MSDYKIPDYEGCGIYAIINVREMRCYIGSSRNIRKRINEHINSLKRNRHSNKLLQEDYNCGAVVDFVLLEKANEEVDKESLIAKEKMYMLAAIDNHFSIYNLIPRTEYEKQREWICTHLLWYFMRNYNTDKIFAECFKEKYGVFPAYMNNRKEENRIKH